MENKLTKLGNTIKNNIHKTVPAFVLLTSLCFAKPSSASAETKYKNYKETPHVELTALGEKAAAKQNAINTYSAKSAEKTLKAILDSDLNKISKYDYNLENEVENKIAKLLTTLNEDGLKLSTAYKKLEDKTIKDSGKSPAEITKIAQNKIAWETVPDEIMRNVVATSAQDDLHTDIDVLSLIRLNAAYGEILVMDEGDNRYDRINLIAKNGKIDLRKDTMSIINNFTTGSIDGKNEKKEFNIPDNVRYFYELKGQNGQAIKSQLETLYKEIATLTSKGNLTNKDSTILKNKCNDAAEILFQTGAFGTKEMCLGVSYQVANSNAIVNTLNHLAQLGYNIEINLDAYAKDAQKTAKQQSQKGSLGFGVGTTLTNERVGANVNMNYLLPLNNNWDMNCLVKCVFYQSTKGNIQDSVQLIGGLGGIYTTNSTNSKLGLTAETGIEFTKKNANILIGINGNYERKLNDNLALRAFTEIISNIEQKTTDYKAGLGVSIKLNNGVILSMDSDFGYTSIPNNKNIITNTKPNDNLPIYGTDEITDSDTETTKTDMTDIPEEKPLDPTLY